MSVPVPESVTAVAGCSCGGMEWHEKKCTLWAVPYDEGLSAIKDAQRRLAEHTEGLSRHLRPQVQPATDMFLRVLYTHIELMYSKGRTPVALLISNVEAGRCGIAEDHETAFGVPIERDESIPLGAAVLRLDDTSKYQFQLPVYFMES